MAANKIYMTAEQHVIIFSRALYPVFDVHGQVRWNECLAGSSERAYAPTSAVPVAPALFRVNPQA